MDKEFDTVGGDDETIWLSACIECVRMECARNLFFARVDSGGMLSSFNISVIQDAQQETCYHQGDTVVYSIWHAVRSNRAF